MTPETRRGRPLGKGAPHKYRAGNGDGTSLPRGVVIPPQARRCPRCGRPFAWTDQNMLRECMELAGVTT